MAVFPTSEARVGYAWLAVLCAEADVPTPSARCYPHGLVELWHNDQCVGGYASPDLVASAGGEPGWSIAGVVVDSVADLVVIYAELLARRAVG